VNNISQKNGKEFEDLENELNSQIKKTPFKIFLCGPSITSTSCSLGADLRKRLKDELERNQFSVILGEDDGLEYLRQKFQHDAQTNELYFIKSPDCRVIILIADSVGSYCELGLFNWLFASDQSEYFDRNKLKFYVIADEQFKDNRSYFNEGPIKTLGVANGNVEFSDFKSFDIPKLVEDIKAFRAINIKPYKVGDK
jgi:hypothetical protein